MSAHEHRRQAQHHEQLADQLAGAHQAAAATLVRFEARECAPLAPATRQTSPLLGRLKATEDIDQGVRIQLAASAEMDDIDSHIRCHLAFAATCGFEGMNECPLFLPTLSATRRPNPASVHAHLGELRRTAAAHSAVRALVAAHMR